MTLFALVLFGYALAVVYHLAPKKARWAVLKERATEAHYLSEHYLPFMYALRNEYLVNHADVCIAYVRNRKSGSGQTLKMAEKKGLTILLL